MTVRLLLTCVLMGGVIAVLHLWVVTAFRVSSGSMSPRVPTGSTVLIDRVGPHFAGWQNGEVVAFHNPVDGALTLKRIVAGPGQTVGIEDQELVVDGKRVDEPYADNRRVGGLYFGPVTVPDDEWFVLGDNRAGSIDSRVFGPVKGDAFTGRMLMSWRVP